MVNGAFTSESNAAFDASLKARNPRWGIRDLESVMRDASICGLGQAAPNPVNHLLKYFRDDL